MYTAKLCLMFMQACYPFPYQLANLYRHYLFIAYNIYGYIWIMYTAKLCLMFMQACYPFPYQLANLYRHYLLVKSQ